MPSNDASKTTRVARSRLASGSRLGRASIAVVMAASVATACTNRDSGRAKTPPAKAEPVVRALTPAPPPAEAPPVDERPCEPERVVLQIPEGDDPHALEVLFGGTFAYRVDHPDPDRWEVLVTPRGRYDDIVENYGASLAPTGRVLYPAKLGPKQQAMRVDGQLERTFEDLSYQRVDPDGRYLYVGYADGRAHLVDTGRVRARTHDSIEHLGRAGDTVLYVAVDGGKAALWRGDDSGPSYDEIHEILALPDGSRVMLRASVGRTEQVVVDDAVVVAGCAEVELLGFADGTAMSACRRKEGWTVHAEGTPAGGPYRSRPQMVFTGPDFVEVVPGIILVPREEGLVEVAGRRVLEVDHVKATSISPDRRRLMVLAERGGKTELVPITLPAGTPGDPWPVASFTSPRDVKLPHDWGKFSADSKRFGFAFGRGKVFVDGARVSPEAWAIEGFSARGDPVLVDESGLRLGSERLVELPQVLRTEVDPSGARVRYIGRRGSAVVEGCTELPG